MRKSVLLGLGLASAAVLAVAGIASASAVTGSRGVAAQGVAARQAMTGTTISQADAERIALETVPGSTVTESMALAGSDTRARLVAGSVSVASPSCIPA